MQAVLLAAGQSGRFYPFSSLGHKCLVKIAGQSLLEHTLSALENTKIDEVILVVQNESVFREIIGDLSRFSFTITFVVQPEALGMGDALLRVREKIHGNFLLMHAHHVDIADFREELVTRDTNPDEMLLLCREEEQVEKYGVLRLENNRVVEIVEKPEKGSEPSRLRVIGIYSLSKRFLDTLEGTPPSHYNLEAAISTYAQTFPVSFIKTEKESITLKHPWDLLRVKDYILARLKKNISSEAMIAPSAHIEGEVVIEEGVKVLEHATIKGPAYIGKNTVIGTNAIIRNGVSIGDDCVAGAHMEIRGSILMDGSSTHSGFIGDSIIGTDCKIAAQFLTTNVRLDRTPISVHTKKGVVDSGRKNLGVMMGHNTKVGGKATTMPGIIIGENVIIGPTTTVMHNVESDVTYFTKFQETVIKHKTDKKHA